MYVDSSVVSETLFNRGTELYMEMYKEFLRLGWICAFFILLGGLAISKPGPSLGVSSTFSNVLFLLEDGRGFDRRIGVIG